MLPNQNRIKQFLTVLKDKDCLQCIFKLLTYLKEFSKYDTLVLKIENEIGTLRDDIDSLYNLFNLEENLCDTPPLRLPKGPLNDFQQYLIQRYISVNFMQTNSSICAPNMFHIRLALIDNNNDEHLHFTDYSFLYEQENDRNYLDYCDIFTDDHRVVVLQGPPGCGKTTLAKHLCKQWANGKLLQKFSHVIFVQLRDERVTNATTFEELIKIYMDILSESIDIEVFKSHGMGLLIILEGWDELPEKIRCKDTIFRSLISGEILPKAVIAVTTRSSFLVNLPINVCRRIEIVGFTKEQIEQYVDYYMDHNDSLTSQFWEQLRDLPQIKKILFVPVILCIVLNIFQQNDKKIPETYTELYTKFLLCQLSIFHSKRSCNHTKFESLDSLPSDISNMVLKFGKMGYYCLLHSKLTFCEEEINDKCFDSKGVPLELGEVAIFEQHIMVNCAHVSKTYQFIHRTFQEILAAWYVSNQPNLFQRKAIKENFRNKKLEAFWMFYAGLTKFNSISFDTAFQSDHAHKFTYLFNTTILSFIGRRAMRFNNIRSIGTAFFTAKLYAASVSNSVPKSFQITLIAAAMESRSPQICKSLCNSYVFYRDICWFTVPEKASTPQILLALSYCMAHSEKKWVIHCERLDNESVDHLLKCLGCDKSEGCTCNNCGSFTNRTDDSIFALDVSSSEHSLNGLAKLIKIQRHIKWIIMSRSKCVDDSLMIELSGALKQNTSLIFLHLYACNITSVGVRALADMLKENSTIEWIGLRDNENTLNEEDIILLLETINNYNATTYIHVNT